MHSTYRVLRKASRALYDKGHWRGLGLFGRFWLGAVLNFRQISQLLRDQTAGNMSKVVAEEPLFWGVLVWPLVDARWPAHQRLRELRLHYAEAADLGHLLELEPREVRSILKLDALNETLEVCLERQPWFNREGQCTLSLFFKGERVYSVAFLLSRESGQRIAYIGAIQGVKQTDADDTYKVLTKAAHGMRPRDLGLAMFLLLCRAMQVQYVLAVQNQNRQHQHRYFDALQRAEVFANYDDIWTENEAVLRSDGLFALQPGARKKDLTEVPSKKRSMYRKREAFLDDCQQALDAVVQSGRYAHPDDDCGALSERAALRPSPELASEGEIKRWLSKVRPAFWGSWLWSFPSLFM